MKFKKLVESVNRVIDADAERILNYVSKHPEELLEFKTYEEYLDELNLNGVFDIPGKAEGFTVVDVNNISEQEAEQYINLILTKTNLKAKLDEIAANLEINNTIVESVDSGNVITWCAECGKKQRVFVKFPDPNGPFEDTEYECERCGAINICHDEHEYNEDGTIKESLNISDYEEVNFDNPDYRIYNKVIRDGSGKIIKGLWAAQKGDEEPFEITYEQARGFEPIDRVDELSRDMGKLILPEERLNEDLEDDFKVLIAASDHKCRLTKYDIEEAADINQLEEYIKECYQVLSEHFGASYIKYWRFTEDGIRIVMIDGTKEDLDIRGGEIVDINESIEQPQETEDEVVYQVGTVKDDDTLAVKDLMSDKDTAINYAHELASWCNCKVRVIKDYLDLVDDEYKKEIILELNGSIQEDKDNKCIICGEEIIGYGNNAEPVAEGRCCDDCNMTKVIPARISQLKTSMKPTEEKNIIKEQVTESTENSNLNMKNSIEEIVFNEFESGHLFADDYESFKSLMRDEGLRATPRAYSYYQELHELGPAGFYDEFKDKFEFDSMFIDEYADIDDNMDETEYIESVKGFKLYDNVVTETGHKGFIIKFLYTDQDDPVAEIKRDWMDSSPIRSYVSKLKHVDNIDEMLTENTLTNYLPPSIDNMLMDMAQMCGEFDYADVYKFTKAGVNDDTVRRLKNLYRRWNRAAEYYDEEKMCILAKEAAQIIGKSSLTESCEYTVKRYGEWHWGIIGPDKLMVRQDDGKLLLFKSKDKATEYIDTLCKNTLTEANTKTAYSYKNYTICYGYKNTDRWYVKDSKNQFVGTVSGYSTEEEAKDYIDSVTMD